MSESAAIPEEIARDLARADRGAYLEQRLFVFSPFGTLITALLIWLLLVASFVAIAFAEHLPLHIFRGGTTMLEPRWRAALTISLLLVTILGAQRYSRVRERADFAAFAQVLRGGASRAFELAGLTPRGVNLTGATIAGLILGLLVAWLFNIGKSASGADRGFVAWMSVIIVLLCMLFARGVTLTRVSGRLTREMIDQDLIIDLLRIDRLAVVGRSAARSALIWFTISAVTCLFFIGGGMDAFTIGLLVGCAAMGVWIFVATMERVHRKIRVVKADALERVRAEIEAVRAQAGQSLPGLLAYEARIAAVHEWPFDQTTLMRVVASAFILAIPWFGQAIAAFAVERFADIAK